MSRAVHWLVGQASISDSPSAALHTAAFAALGGPARYDLRVVDDDDDDPFAAAEAVCRGINVTAPWKLRAFQRYRAQADAVALATGAVNTVRYDDDGHTLVATNTDVYGVLTAWRRAALHVEGKTLTVLGAGAAARAVVAAAAAAGVAGLRVWARRPEAATTLAVLAAVHGLEAAAVDDDAELGVGPAAAGIVIAASALDDVAAVLARHGNTGAFVHDLRCGSAAVPTRNAALARHMPFLDGTTMLLGQAEAAAALFLGEKVLPVVARVAMSKALADWLRRR